jgi:hypothetical protein
MINLKDKVKIVNYGSPVWVSKNSLSPKEIDEYKSRDNFITEDEDFVVYDMSPQIVNKESEVIGYKNFRAVGGIVQGYQLKGFDGLFSIEQLEKI